MTKWCSGQRFATVKNSISPLGLEPEGIAVDFQGGVNNYLYGTRFFSYLALIYGPDKAMDWLRRPEGSRAFYAGPFQAGLRPRAERRVERLDCL